MTTATTTDAIRQEIEREVSDNTILVYTKGTKEEPRCGFTMGIKAFFEKFGYPFTFVDVLDNPEKRQVLSEMTDWPTLPKVFIAGEFYGDDDILAPMADKGELQDILKKAFGE